MDKMPPDKQMEVAGNPMAVRQALDSVMAWLRPLGPSTMACGEVELVLAEVMNNVVEHAFAEMHDGQISLQISPVETGLDCMVQDNGRSMLESSLPTGDQPDLNGGTDDLPEGGFGWFLIRDLTQDIEYKCGKGDNQLSFHIPLEFGQKPDNSH